MLFVDSNNSILEPKVEDKSHKPQASSTETTTLKGTALLVSWSLLFILTIANDTAEATQNRKGIEEMFNIITSPIQSFRKNTINLVDKTLKNN